MRRRSDALPAKRRTILVAAGAAVLASGGPALAQGPSEKVRKINLYTWPQAALPQAYQASQLIAQEWRKLGLDVDVKPLQRQAQTQLIWFTRDKWDATMWRMVGRPERSDPDELLYSLYHSKYAEKGYNFIGYINPEYDALAEKQRTQLDPEERRKTAFKMQEIIDRDQPQAFLVHPKYLTAFNKAVFKEDSVVNESGIGIRNIWTFLNIEPLGAQKDLIINSNEVINATNPLYIGGAVDSWVTDLIWDRVMRIGPDGMPKPWAAESVSWIDDTTVDIKLRPGMKWHDGQPVTVEDVIFSFQAPAGDKAPMYKPFVTDIVAMEKTGDLGVRFKLKAPNTTFFTASLAKINLIPKHIWEPVLKDLAGKPETAEQLKDVSRIGSGPFKLVRWAPNEEIVLERFGEHFAAPKVARWIMRIVPNAEATLGMLKSGEINFLGMFGGDPDVLIKFAKDNPNIAIRSEVDIGFEYVAFNNRRPPFDDVAFRRALSLAIDRRLMVSAAWGDYAIPANSYVSPVLKFWHDPAVDDLKTGLAEAKKILKDAGYRLVGGKLYYPAGKQEKLTTE
ncbi:MAG: twin-arginine translocation pathway signal protein [Alphaproteobacteria bacterium]|nr:twin-arginine translocation pathway signal protein [Alphaproteobacteria bacterium]